MSLLTSFTRTPANVSTQINQLAGVLPPSAIATGRFLTPTSVLQGGAPGTRNITADRLYAAPVFIGRGQTFAADRIGIRVTTGSAGAAYLGVFANHATAFRPDALVLDAGTVDTTSTAVVTATISQTFTGDPLYGVVWLVLVGNATPALQCVTGGADLYGADTGFASTPTNSIYMAHAYGALPSSFSSTPTTETNGAFRIGLRKA